MVTPAMARGCVNRAPQRPVIEQPALSGRGVGCFARPRAIAGGLPVRIAFVSPEPRNSAGYQSHSNKFGPLGLLVLAERTPREHEVVLYDESCGATTLDKDLAAGTIDLCAVTAMTSGATRAYEIAGWARSAGVPCIMGGYHASFVTDEAVRYFDSVATGECDEIWPDIVADAAAGRLKPRYHGSLADLGTPGIGRGRQDLQPINGQYQMHCVQTSRGCPVGCRFCSVTRFNGPRIRRRDPEAVLEEWNAIPTGATLFVVDDNFYGLSRKDAEWAKTLCRLLIEKGRHHYWFSQTTLNMADDDEGLRLAYQAGCRVMLVGFESFSTETLTQYNKGLNRRNVGRYQEVVAKFHRAGIGVLGSFIVGGDGDDTRTAEATREITNRLGFDVVQITNLTPLPGTDLFDGMKREGRLLTKNFPEDWERHTFLETVFKPRGASAYELDRSLWQLRRDCFKPPMTVLTKMVKTFRQTRSVSTALMARGMNNTFKGVARYFARRDRARFRQPPGDGRPGASDTPSADCAAENPPAG